MNLFLSTVGLFAIGYLIGAIPFSFIIGKIWGKDIRKEGSGNVGATNVLRTCGKFPGILAYVFDIGKGLAAWFLLNALYVYFLNLEIQLPWSIVLVAALFPIIGHTKTVFLGFAGGKGVAVTAGVMAGMIPIPFLFALTVFFIVFGISRIVSISSMVASIGLVVGVAFHPLLCTIVSSPLFTLTSAEAQSRIVTLSISVAVSVFLIYKHKSNIVRLIRGEENAFRKEPAA